MDEPIEAPVSKHNGYNRWFRYTVAKMGSKEFGNSHNVGGKDAGAIGFASNNVGQYKWTQQEKERFVKYTNTISNCMMW